MTSTGTLKRTNLKSTIGRQYTLTAAGHSLCQSIANGVRFDRLWPELLAADLRALGCGIKARNFGRAGNASGPYGISQANTTISAVTDGTHITVASAAGMTLYDVLYINGQRSYINGLSGTAITLGTPVINMLAGMVVQDAGNRNLDTISRFPEMTLYDVPDLAILWIGENDTFDLWDSNTAPTKSTNITDVVVAGSSRSQIIVNGASASKFVAKQALIVGGPWGTTSAPLQVGIVQSISGSGPYTITLAAPLAMPPTTGSYVGQGTQPNIQWLVQSLINAGTTKVIVCGSHALNFDKTDASTGDFYGGTVTPYVPYQNLRTYQKGAATASYAPGPNGAATVVYCDLFNALVAIAKGTASNTSGGSTGTNPFPAPYNQVTYNGVTYTFGPGVDCTPNYGGTSFAWHVLGGAVATSSPGGTLTGYTNGATVVFSGGQGQYAAGTVTVTAGTVTGVTFTQGTGYKIGDVLTDAAGGGLTVTVNSLSENIHLNELGNYLVSQILLAVIVALNWQTSWLPS